MKDAQSMLLQGAEKLGLQLNATQAGQFMCYLDFLWQEKEKQNLTALTSDLEIVEKHFLDSLSVSQVVDLQDGKSVLDVGSGAGFPGVPLKILNPGINLFLLEAQLKRVYFLRALVKRLNLKGVEVFQARAEDFSRNTIFRGKFNLVLARAVAKLPVLAEYCLPALEIGGFMVALKGPLSLEEVEAAGRAIYLLGGEKPAVHALVLPFSGARRIIVRITKIKNTPDAYPRRAGIPEKRPLG